MTDSPSTVKSSRLPSGLQHPVCRAQRHVSTRRQGWGSWQLASAFLEPAGRGEGYRNTPRGWETPAGGRRRPTWQRPLIVGHLSHVHI